MVLILYGMIKIEVGNKYTLKRSFSIEDVKSFAKISNDYNPIHLEEDYASKSIFKKRIVHGTLLIGVIGSILGTKLPGMGTIYLGHVIKFIKPVFIDDEILFEVEVISKREDKPIYTLSTICKNCKDEQVIKGEAVVLFDNH